MASWVKGVDIPLTSDRIEACEWKRCRPAKMKENV